MHCVLYITFKLNKHQVRSFLNFPSEPLEAFYIEAMNYGAHIVNILSPYLPRKVLSNWPKGEVSLMAGTSGQ